MGRPHGPPQRRGGLMGSGAVERWAAAPAATGSAATQGATLGAGLGRGQGATAWGVGGGGAAE